MDCLKKLNGSGMCGGKKTAISASDEPVPAAARAPLLEVDSDTPGSSGSSNIDTSPAGMKRFLNLGNSQDDEEGSSSDGNPQYLPEDDGYRLSDGYPLVVDESTQSERQNHLARQRLIENVIQEQNQYDQDVLEELERANMQRVFEDDEEEEEEPEGERSRHSRAANAIHHDGVALTPHAEEAIANFMLRKYSEPTRLEVPPEIVEETRAVNILPVSRHLELPVNSLVAFGRRPSTSSSNKNRRTANVADFSPLGWQGSKSSLKDRLEFMLCNELLADVYFFVGKDDLRQRIPAHKFVLSIGSVVFDAMFNGGLTPHNSKEPLEIELPDVEPSAFLTLLKFLYTDSVKIEPENVMTTLYTAKKYAVPAMESACVEFLTSSLSADNAFMLLTQARLFDEPQLEQLCLEIIDKNTHEALTGDGFTEIDLETLSTVLRRDSLRIREIQLFQAVLRWATAECARRRVENTPEAKRAILGKTLEFIRFPAMTIEEFAQHVAQSGLLSDRELVEMFLFFTVTPKPKTPFNEAKRCCIAGKELSVARFQRTEVRWGYHKVPDRIKFTVDTPIYVVGFGLYGAATGPEKYSVTIQIIHCGTGKVVASHDTSFVCDGSSSIFRAMFKDPVEISPSVTYIASAFLKGPESHYGTKGLRRIVHQSGEGTVTFQFTYAAGNNNGTSVEDGQIPEIIFHRKHV